MNTTNPAPSTKVGLKLFAAVILTSAFFLMVRALHAQTRVIEVLADHDSRYKIQGQKVPSLTFKAGEQMILRITAKKAENRNRDGSIHGFTLLRASDRKPVPGWDFLLKPGTRDISVTAPLETGEYIVICTVICSMDHEGMNMKIIVVPVN
ncbi:MAG TPA: hypothetical protein VFP96_08270 [Candidatus Acidoferrum sp.]|nr:hypothetical protein [Candidatus Acidoferrum sp.]